MCPYNRRVLGLACYALAAVFLLRVCLGFSDANLAYLILAVLTMAAGLMIAHVEPPAPKPWPPASPPPPAVKKQYLPPHLRDQEEDWDRAEKVQTPWTGPRRD